MAITVANLLAQVGADLTQFKAGMNEVDARLNQAASRSVSAGNRVDALRAKVVQATSDADKMSAEALAATASAQSLATSITRLRAEALTRVDPTRATRELAENRVAELQRRQGDESARAAEKISTFEAQSIVQQDLSDRYTAKSGVQAGKGNQSAAARWQAQAVVAANKAAEYDRLALEAEAVEMDAQANLQRQIVVAEARVTGLRARELELTLGKTAEIQSAEAAQAAAEAKSARLSTGAMGLRVTATNTGNVAADMERDAAAADAVVQAHADKLAENAREHSVRAFNGIANAAQTAGVVIAGSLAAATATGSGFNSMMSKAEHNTSLTTLGVDQMREAVEKMGSESGADLGQLASGFQKVENFSFDATDATKITQVAMQSAVATGADMAGTSELLAKSLVQFGMGADRAQDAMNTMHVAANLSSLEMQQLVDIGGQTYSMASNLGVSFVEANAALVTFTKQGLNAREAMTQFRNDLQKLQNPTKEVKKELDDLSKRSGVDLVKTFSYTGLQSKGLTGAFTDIRTVADKLGYTVEQLANKLFPSLRGTIGAMILSSDAGFNTFTSTVDTLNDAMAGKLDPTTTQYAETLKLTETQFNRVRNMVTLMTADIATALSPAVFTLTGYVHSLVAGFTSLSPSVQQARVNAALGWGIFLVGAGVIGKLIVGLSALKTAFLALTETETMAAGFKVLTTGLLGIGTAAKASMLTFGPWALVIAGVIAAVTYFSTANEHFNTEIDNANKSVAEQASQFERGNEAMATSAEHVRGLIDHYVALQKVVKPTKEQTAQMHDVLNNIAKIAPEAIKGYDAAGNAIGLVGDLAAYSTKNINELHNAMNRGKAMELRATMYDKQDYVGALKRYKAALQSGDTDQYAAVSEGINTRNWMGMLEGTAVSAKTEAFGLPYNPPSHAVDDQGDSRLDASFAKAMMPKIDQQIAQYDAEMARMRAAAQQFTPGYVSTKPKASKTTGTGAYPGAPDADKKIRDPLDEWRDRIIELDKQTAMLGQTSKTSNELEIDWMKNSEGPLREKLKLIKSLDQLYHMAGDSARKLDAGQKRVETNKAFKDAMDRLDKQEHGPASNRLQDVAVYENVHDPVRARGTQAQKDALVAKAATQQALDDAETATKQADSLWKQIEGYDKRETTVYDKTLEEIHNDVELYAEIGEQGANVWAAFAQSVYDAAEKAKKAQEMWLKGAAGVSDAQAKLAEVQRSQNGFGEDQSAMWYIAGAAIELYKTSLENLDPVEAEAAMLMGLLNKEAADTKSVQDYTSKVAELSAEFQSLTMTGGEYQKWLLKTTGHTESQIDAMGTFKGLTSQQYRTQYNAQQDVDQAGKYQQVVAGLRSQQEQLGLVRWSSKDAQVAWEQFGTSIDSMSPQMQSKVHQLSDEFKHLDQIKKVQRIWEQAAGTLEDAFTNAFDAVIDKHETFWKAFETSLKSNVAHILAGEAAKAMVKFIGQITGLAGYGKGKDVGGKPGVGSADGNPTASLAGAAAVALGAKGSTGDLITGALGALGIGGATKGPGNSQPVYIVGVAPGVSMGALGGLGGGDLSSMFDWGNALTTGLSGSGTGAPGSSEDDGWGTALSLGMMAMSFFAGGGRPMPRSPMMLGEDGPEIWVPDISGSVYPNGHLPYGGGGGSDSGVTVVNTGDYHVSQQADIDRVSSATATKLQRKLRYGATR